MTSTGLACSQRPSMSARDASDHVSNHCLKQIAFFYSGQFYRFLHTVRTCSIRTLSSFEAFGRAERYRHRAPHPPHALPVGPLAEHTAYRSHRRSRAVASLSLPGSRSLCNGTDLMQSRCNNAHKFWHGLLFPIQRRDEHGDRHETGRFWWWCSSWSWSWWFLRTELVCLRELFLVRTAPRRVGPHNHGYAHQQVEASA